MGQKLTKVAAVIFDAGGTLVDTQEPLMLAMGQTLAEFGLPCPPQSRLRANLGWAEPLLLRGLVPPEVEAQAVASLRSRTVQALGQVRPISGARAALERLRAAGLRLALVSGFGRETLDTILAPLGWARMFEATVAGDEVPRPRPAPDLLLAAAGRLATPVAACLAVGDSLYDLRSAQACGMAFVGVLTGAQAEELSAQQLPRGQLLPSVAELPEALLEKKI